MVTIMCNLMGKNKGKSEDVDFDRDIAKFTDRQLEAVKHLDSG